MRVYVRNLGGTPIILNALALPLDPADLDALIAELIADGAIREKLTANRTYFVRTDGSDSNTGLVDSAGGAFLTLQHAYDVVVANLDLAGFTVTIQVRSGTFTAGVSLSQMWTGGGLVIFQGDTVTPANVVINPTAADCFNITAILPGILVVRGFKLQSTTSGDGINLQAPGIIQFQNIDFGAMTSGNSSHIVAETPGARIQAIGNYSITGGAFTHWRSIFASSNITVQSRTITITGTPAFGLAFAQAGILSSIVCDGNTFSGSATGTRFNASNGGTIFTAGAGATYLPGNVAGVGSDYGTPPWGLYN